MYTIPILKKSFWKGTIRPEKRVLTMSLIALLMALQIVISTFFIPVGDTSLRIYFSFIPTSLASIVGGPVFSLGYGFCVDILGFIAHPTGAFFPGYILSSMLGAFIYALFLHNQKITVVKITLCKLTINVLINICLGSLWNMIVFEKAYMYFLLKSVVKNIALLPLEVIIMVLVFKLLLPRLKQMGVISNGEKHIPIW